MKYNVICADPPWNFSDPLVMSGVKRGAISQYRTLNLNDIKNLDVSSIAEDDAVLILWVPSSMLQDGLDVMKSWGFAQKQTYIWVKIKKNLKLPKIKYINEILAFFMGRLFRQTHEIALIGTKGKIYSKLQNRSQRSVVLDVNLKHSAKPEGLQDSLDIMFPSPHNTKVELFARRSRPGWDCVGLECPDSLDEDIRDSIERLKNK